MLIIKMDDGSLYNFNLINKKKGREWNTYGKFKK